MSERKKGGPALLLGCLLVVGCGKGTDPAGDKLGAGDRGGGDKDKYLLKAEPAGSKGVLAVRKEARDGDEVVVVGRIGGRRPFTGRASFTIVDPSLKPCNEREDDACPTPWDYCCDTPQDLARATVLVKFVDDQGKTLADDVEKSLGLKPLQTVMVKGKARVGKEGGLTAVVAEGLYVKP
jgi:hypothetical protein